jgi:ribonuclease HII
VSVLRIGVDENGLGARLGPLIVTAVLAEASANGEQWLRRRPRGRLARDLGDSKNLVAHGNVDLGEAWARVVGAPQASSPGELLEVISRKTTRELRAFCPNIVQSQCWNTRDEEFTSNPDTIRRLQHHRQTLTLRGVRILRVKTEIVCVEQLNRERGQGSNRFLSDLHAMERLVLSLRSEMDHDVIAVLGKVGGMSDYTSYFGPLGGRLHVQLEQSRRVSAYQFPQIGQLRFVQDADGQDALVMLASLIGKYVRELLMGRIWRFYDLKSSAPAQQGEHSRGARSDSPVSGYHDPRTRAFVEASKLLRHERRVPTSCFERTLASQ